MVYTRSNGGTYDFHHSLVAPEGKIRRGRYTLILRATWDKSAVENAEYRELMLRIFAHRKIDLKEV